MKKLLLVIAVLLVLGGAAGAYWWLSRPQVLVFSDDAKLTLLGVEYGKRHAPPSVKFTGTNRPGARTARGGSFTTSNDTLVIWVRQEYDSQQYHNFQYYAYDKAGTATVQTYPRNYGPGRQGNQVVAVQFDAFPRRQGKFYVKVQENGNGADEFAEKQFVIANPARGSFASWSPEPVPTTKTDDDVSVTLTKLVAGVSMNRGNLDPDDAANKGVSASFHIERNGKPVSNWQPVSVETTDATGNHVNGWVPQNWVNGRNVSGNWPNGDGTVTYQYGLWPDEPAWKIKLEFSQQSDYAENESWSVAAVPVVPGKQQEMWNYAGRRQTNSAPFAETDLNGFHVKLLPAKQFTDAGQNDWMQGALFVQVTPEVGEGYRMAVTVTDDQTNTVQASEYNTSRNNNMTSYRYRLQDIAGLTNINVTVALHKSRFFEFTAKPAKAEAADSPQN